MNLLRFDLPEAWGTAGFKQDALQPLWPRIERLRAELVALGSPLEDASICLPTDHRSFFRLPEQQLGDYVRIREASTLGKIFQVANGLHDQIDAIVVLGDIDLRSGAQALMQAGCDPYHNELTRAARGSKPRVYFEPNPYDNDGLVALLDRLRRPHWETWAERRWAVVSLRDGSTATRDDVALKHLVGELTRTLDGEVDRTDRQEIRSRLLIPVGPHDPTSAIKSMDPATEFEISPGLAGSWSVLSPAGLLPAAMLGLDCMKLLAGALAINQYFESTPLEQNFVAQLAALHHLSARRSPLTQRIVCFWSQALERLGPWYQGVMQTTGQGMGIPETLSAVCASHSTTSYVQPRDWGRFRARLEQHHEPRLVHHWLVTKSRTDPLGTESLDQRLAAFFQVNCGEPSGDQAVKDEDESGSLLATRTTLSQLDTYEMGQAFQFLMLATWIEKRLAWESD